MAVTAIAGELRPVAWSELEFSASKFFLKATTVVTIDRLGSEESELALRDAEGARQPSGAMVKITLATDLPMGRSELATVWVDGMTGAALQREKRVGGRKQYWKLHRYLSDGYEQWRAAPDSSKEEDLALEAWSKRNQKRVTLDLPRGAPAGTLTDSYALLYLVSAAGLTESGKELEVLIADDDQLISLHFVAGALTERRVDFQELGAGSQRRRSERVRLRRVTVTGEAFDGSTAADDVDTGFMGMQGGLTILLDPTSGVPVEVSGRSKGIGQLTVHLDRAVMGG